ncbi:hypothetical protein EV702DRAFT_1201867 [Suillus placidus]|uniref:Uncharacterized protein n=1 Tax=Suillus placidus TaxID=48579 RepID=A0A9P7CZ18_9AGAM|nr:hypothetical protein EV702DRAFT_1201867 [Suillus placidus]
MRNSKLNTTRAQRDVRLAEKKLTDCILKENAALGVFYEFKATEAERKLEDADIEKPKLHPQVAEAIKKLTQRTKLLDAKHVLVSVKGDVVGIC